VSYSVFDETMVDMTWPEIEKAVEQGAIVLLPTGVIEEHGPHMGLGVDTYCSYLMCKLVRHDLEAKKIKTLIAPPFYWGINNATGSFSGSFTVRKETMKNVLYDIFVSLKRWGITYVFNINWHGDHEHNVTILEAVKEARIDTGIRAYCVLDDYDAKRFGLTGREAHVIFWKNPRKTKLPSERLEIHADMTETSVMAHYFPDQVNVELTKTLKSTNLTFDDLLVWRQGWSDARKVTPLGYFGDPASFDPMVGKQLMEDDARNLAHLIETFLKGDYKVPEI
jgi:creatinine amidohydrolase